MNEKQDLADSKRHEDTIAKFCHGREVDVHSEDYDETRTGILRKIFGEKDSRGFQVWYVYDSNFSRAEGTVSFSAHDVQSIGAHWASITLRKV